MTIKILLADDRYLMLKAIEAVLEQEPEIKIVGTAQNGQVAIAQAKKLQPDILLIDIEMPVMNGIRATKYITKYVPHTKVIILTSHKSQEYLDRALKAGASGYLLKDSLLKDLKKAIYSLGRNNYYIDAQLLTRTVKKIQKTNIIKYQQRVTYLKKYQKSIYTPSRQNLNRKIITAKSSHSNLCDGITKANLAGIFEPSLVDTRAPLSDRVALRRLNRKRYLKKVVWILIAIATFILTLIVV